jgi:hypothetical protein
MSSYLKGNLFVPLFECRPEAAASCRSRSTIEAFPHETDFRAGEELVVSLCVCECVCACVMQMESVGVKAWTTCACVCDGNGECRS